jgi:hypothetical protein
VTAGSSSRRLDTLTTPLSWGSAALTLSVAVLAAIVGRQAGPSAGESPHSPGPTPMGARTQTGIHKGISATSLAFSLIPFG